MKYSRTELRRRARLVLQAKKQGDERHLSLILTISLRMGLSPNEVESRIKRLAA